MKSILIVDTPKDCGGCQCLHDELWMCQADTEHREAEYFGRPSWCPLRPLPCKKYMRQIPLDVLEMGKRKRDFIIHKVDVDNSYAEGWNACLNAITNHLGERTEGETEC